MLRRLPEAHPRMVLRFSDAKAIQFTWNHQGEQAEHMIRQAIEKLLEGEDLTPAEVEGVMEEVFADRVTPAQETAFSTALGMKGIANSELSAMQAAHARLSAVAGKRPPRAGYEKAFLPGSALAAQLVLTHRSDLTRREADHAMEEILSGRADDTEIAMFLTALRFKGETVDEV